MEVSLRDLKELLSAPCRDDAPASNDWRELGIRIVVLQRGWVVVGRLAQRGSEMRITSGHCVRRWGTSLGLGELAKDGPRAETKLDPLPETRFHELTVVLSLLCRSESWESECR